MQRSADKKDNKTLKHIPAFETFALAGGKRAPKSKTTVPTEQGVREAKDFVEENKK